MPLFAKKSPLDELVKRTIRVPKRELLKVAAVARAERAGGTTSPLTGRVVSQNDALWALLTRGIAAYEAEHGVIDVSDQDELEDEEDAAEKSGARPAAKKGASSKVKK